MQYSSIHFRYLHVDNYMLEYVSTEKQRNSNVFIDKNKLMIHSIQRDKLNSSVAGKSITHLADLE